MRKKSIGLRLTLSIWLLLLVAMVPSYLYFSRMISRDVIDETQSRAVAALEMTAWLMAEHPVFTSERELDGWVTTLGEKLGIRVTYIVAGRVAADSNVGFDKVPDLETHEFRTEVGQAEDGGLGVSVRYSETLKQEMLYAAKKIQGPSGIGAGILRLAIPFSGVKARLGRLDSAMLWVFVVSLVLAGLFSLAVSRRLSSSIQRLSNAAAAIGRGGYGKRIHDYPGAEFTPLVDAFNEMSENIRRQIMTVEEQKWQLDALFNAMAEGVVILDAKGRILSSNHTLKTMFPGAAGSVGRHHLETLGRPEVQQCIEAVAGGGEDEASCQTMLDLPDGRVLRVRVMSLRDRDDVLKIIAVFRDVSESQRLERVRRDFVANVSHELKTPITSIKGYAETLLDEPAPDDEAREKFLRIILNNANHMNKMVGGLLRLAKSESGPEKQLAIPVDAAEVAAECLEAIRPAAERKGIALANELPESGPIFLTSRDGLRETLGNLLDNAVKFSPEGGAVTLGVREREGAAAVYVADQGPGVAPENRFKIFERFVRLGQGTGKSGSAGLGLAIARRIVESYGGEIGVEDPSAGERGALFWFSLPGPQ